LNDRRRSVILSWLVFDLGGNLKEKTFELDLWNRTVLRKRFNKRPKEEVEKTEKKGRRATEEIEQKRKKKSRFDLGDLWRERGLMLRIVQVALRFFSDILAVIRWDRLFLEVDVATPDPALTGILYGELCAIGYWADSLFPRAHIRVEPDFVNKFPRGSTESVFSVRLLNVVAPASRMFFAMPKTKMIKTFILKKRR
jgi:hypothetical protein